MRPKTVPTYINLDVLRALAAGGDADPFARCCSYSMLWMEISFNNSYMAGIAPYVVREDTTICVLSSAHIAVGQCRFMNLCSGLFEERFYCHWRISVPLSWHPAQLSGGFKTSRAWLRPDKHQSAKIISSTRLVKPIFCSRNKLWSLLVKSQPCTVSLHIHCRGFPKLSNPPILDRDQYKCKKRTGSRSGTIGG